MSSETHWFVYIVQCHDGSLYTGITKNLERRIKEHNFGKAGAKYTRSRRPVHLVYHEKITSRSAAAKREYLIKQMPPTEKAQLIKAADNSGAETF